MKICLLLIIMGSDPSPSDECLTEFDTLEECQQEAVKVNSFIVNQDTNYQQFVCELKK